jgi:hypothetical protein
MSSSSSSSSHFGTYGNHAAAKAFQSNKTKSVLDAKYAKLPPRDLHRGPDPLLFSVGSKGKLHHFKTIHPTDVVAGPITKG